MATINRFKLAGGVFFWCLSITSLSHAQIVPDNSLGNESSIVRPDKINGIPSDRITGGAKRGTNLFHSFREFNIDEGQGVYFNNPQGVQIRQIRNSTVVEPIAPQLEMNVMKIRGSVEINGVLPARGFNDRNIISYLGQNRCRKGRESQFIITGRGGLPDSPLEDFGSHETWEDMRIIPQNSEQANNPSVQELGDNQTTIDNKQKSIVEAQGWIVNSQGKVVLVVNPVAVVPYAPIWTQAGCMQPYSAGN